MIKSCANSKTNPTATKVAMPSKSGPPFFLVISLTSCLAISLVQTPRAHAFDSNVSKTRAISSRNSEPSVEDEGFSSGESPAAAQVLSSAPVSSLDDGSSSASDEEMHYDDIVKSLQTQEQHDQEVNHRLQMRKSKVPVDPFANVWMHGGFGWATSFQSITDSRGRSVPLNQKGIQATLGIDLFSPSWEAEGAARSMGGDGSQGDTVSLKEFDLKILYKNQLSARARYRLGGGLSGRYMSVHTAAAGTENFTTPAAVATFGIDFFFTKQFSIGADTSVRSSLIAETVDRSSIDAVMRVDAHF